MNVIFSEKTILKNWVVDTTPEILHSIHDDDVNIAIYDRDTSTLTNEIDRLLEQDIEFRASGQLCTIVEQVVEVLDTSPLLLDDVKALLDQFQKVSKARSFRLLLTIVKTDMCRKFHTDINDLRMLCTYKGPGTLWLKDDNVNLKALGTSISRNSIVIDEEDIQQVATGSVAILKGAIYPGAANGIVHRSPTIETTKEKRLILRIDTNATQNLWK